VATSGRHAPAVFEDEAFAEDLARYDEGSNAALVATLARRQFERDGVPVDALLECEAEGRDGTSLEGCLKVYVPVGSRSDEQRFGMVFDAAEPEQLVFLAFGVRHQPKGSRRATVYVIAHHRLHGSWPPRVE
jgi:hypothetical protein